MATPYNRTVNQAKNQPVKAKDSWFSEHKALIIITISVVTFIAWFNSDCWPWPSENRIRERLDKVIDVCMGNENSYDCKNIQKKYGMTFRYCHSITDTDKTQTAYLNGRSIQIPYFPWYAVAWEGKSSEPPKNETRLPNGATSPSLSIYYGCQEHEE